MSSTTQAAPITLQQVPRAWGSASRTRRELSIFLQNSRMSSCGRARSAKGSRSARGRAARVRVSGASTGPAGESFLLKNAGSVAMVFMCLQSPVRDRLPFVSRLLRGPRLFCPHACAQGSDYLHGAELGAPCRGILLNLFRRRFERVFGQERCAPFTRQRPELLLHLPVVTAHETDHHHAPAAF